MLARVGMVRPRQAVQVNLLIGQPGWSSIQQLTARRRNDGRVGSIQAVPELLSEIARMSRTLGRTSKVPKESELPEVRGRYL